MSALAGNPKAPTLVEFSNPDIATAAITVWL